MIVCPKCSTEFSHDADGIGPEGITVRCSVCSHIFHVEVDTSVPTALPRTWQLRGGGTTTTAADIPAILQAIEAGKLTPDHELSRAGSQWVRLGDLPEFSSIFAGYEGLPQVIEIREEAGSMAFAPSGFGAAVAQALATGPDESGSEHSDFLPAPPAHGVDAAPPGMRRPASMLEAVTNAVASGMQERDEDAPSGMHRHRSEPILVSDLEREAATQLAPQQDASSASSSVQVPATERSTVSQDASITSTDAPPPSEVLIVKVDNSGSQNSLFWYALMGLALGCVVILAVPELREAVWSYNNPGQATPPVGVVQPPTDSRIPELASSRQAIYNVGLAESEQAQKDLQRVIDNPEVGEQKADMARLAKAELLAMRALAFTLALSVESTAHGGLARTRAKEDAEWSRLLLAAINQTRVPDRVQLTRVEAALDLVEGKDTAAILSGLPVQGAEVMRLVVEAAPLWRDPQVSVPPGLISRLRSVVRPPTTIESVLALALVRSRDNKRALAVVEQVLARVADQPTALTLKPWIEAKIAAEQEAAGSGDSGETGGSTQENLATETGEDGSGSKVNRKRVTGDELRRRSTAGCQEVRSGDVAKGLDALLTVAGMAKPVPFDTALCLGEGFAKQNRYAPALTWFEKAVSQQPRNVQAREGAGDAAARTNKVETAVRHYAMLRDVNPNHPDAIAYLAKHKPDTFKKKDLLPAKDGADPGSGE